MKTLEQLFLNELADMYDAEHRITKALPKLARAATCAELRSALLTHLKETEEQTSRLEQVFKLVGQKPKAKKCEATVGLLTEGADLAAENKGSPTINAAIISAAQKVEHYEIASYGCLYQWAMLLGQEKAAELLEESLDEEKQADRILTELAEAKNLEALDEFNDEAAPAKGRKGLQARSTRARRTVEPAMVMEE
jgi:ferritin-like metal-binding protein YciE